MKPKTAKELSRLVAKAKTPFELVGTGTKHALGRPVAATKLDLSAFNKVIGYEPDELILECGAAMKLADVQKLLKRKNQMLAFEPPDFSKLLGGKHSGTIGGALLCNLGGPRRLKMGAARDHILGVAGVNGKGEIISAGARVVKNVTGYDVPRLVAGSHGTLLALTSVIFKVHPAPETELTLHLKCRDLPQAVSLMSLALRTSAEVSSAAFVPQQGVYLRLEGIAPSVASRRTMLAKEFSLRQNVLPARASAKLWASIRDVAPLWKHKTKNIWRVSVAPMDAPRFIAALGDVDYFCDWAGGLVWLALPPEVNPRKHLRGGHATLFRASAKTPQTIDVFQPLDAATLALSLRLKQAFDPRRILNPGRMYREI